MHALLPRAEDLVFEPELAALALLDAALVIAVQALIAQNPEMLLGEELSTLPPRAAAARAIVILHGELSDALDAYRELLPPAHDPPGTVGTDELPF